MIRKCINIVAIAVLKGFAFNFSNPFFDFPSATFEDTRETSILLLSFLTKLVAVCNHSLDQTISELTNLSDASCKYLSAVKGFIKQVKDSGSQKEIYSSAFSLIDNLDQFMGSIVRRPSKQHIISISKLITRFINSIQSALEKNTDAKSLPPSRVNYKAVISQLLSDLQSSSSSTSLKQEGSSSDIELLSIEISKNIIELVSIGFDSYQSQEGNIIFESDFASEILVSVQSLVSTAQRLRVFAQPETQSVSESPEDRLEKIEKIASQLLTAAGKYLSALYSISSTDIQEKLSDAAKSVSLLRLSFLFLACNAHIAIRGCIKKVSISA